MKSGLKSAAARPKQARRDPDRAGQSRQIESPYLTSTEAVVYLRLPSLSSLYSHIRENQLPVCRAGGDLRFDRRELDAWLRGATSLELVRKRG
jgi:excisionase family DNA binding protein